MKKVSKKVKKKVKEENVRKMRLFANFFTVYTKANDAIVLKLQSLYDNRVCVTFNF